jgi:hypothetical protein
MLFFGVVYLLVGVYYYVHAHFAFAALFIGMAVMMLKWELEERGTR